MNFAAFALFIVAILLTAALLATTSILNALALLVPLALFILFVGISANEQRSEEGHREDNWRHYW